jgi:hypothetical protein
MRSTLFYVHKANHGAGAAADFDKAALDHVGGAQFAPQVAGERKERQQLGQVLLQPPHHRRVSSAPAGTKGAKRCFGLPPNFGQIDGLGSGLHFVLIPLPCFL